MRATDRTSMLASVFVLVLALAPALGGCTMAPAYVRPAAPVPAAWPDGGGSGVASSGGDAAADGAAITFDQIFTDRRLQALVAQALEHNRDLRVAAANVVAARARVTVQRAAQLPSLSPAVGVNRRTELASGSEVTSYSASAGISAFELDLFGRLASATQAERDTALATEAAARSVRLALVADLASAWASYAADAELLRLAQRTADSARQSQQLVQARFAGGVAARTDLAQAEQLLATAEADVAQQKTALAQDRNLIDLLVGASVDPALLADDLGVVADGIRPLAPGTGSQVLLRRPDVVAAEYRLRAANANVGVARGALFPRISLTGLLGLASDSLSTLFTSGALSATTSATASYAIFSGGGARANVKVSEAQRQAAVATYEQTIQSAFRDVADVLARQATIGDQLAAVARRTDAAAQSARLVEARYRGGVASSLENLDARRSHYAAQQQLLALRLVYVNNRIALYRSLGGDSSTMATVLEKGS